MIKAHCSNGYTNKYGGVDLENILKKATDRIFFFLEKKQMEPNQMYELLQIKGNHKQNKKTTYRTEQK